jgi:hypothetical protein
VAEIRVGKPDVKPDTPAHVKGVHGGNEGPSEKNSGFLPDGSVTATRSTGINPNSANPIDPRMPNLPPA